MRIIMATQTIKIDGKQFVLIPRNEYKRLKAAADIPDVPPPDRRGLRPAKATLDALIAQNVVGQRRAAGLTQEELAKHAGVRVETISRIENGRHLPSVRTLQKLQAALEGNITRSKPKTAGVGASPAKATRVGRSGLSLVAALTADTPRRSRAAKSKISRPKRKK